MVDAWRQVRAWLACEATWIPQPTEHHADLDELLALPGVHANLVPDAHLAALAMEHGLTLCSTDGDFARFPSLRLLNPLAPCVRVKTCLGPLWLGSHYDAPPPADVM